jgi:hypothetical protein
MTAPDRRLLDLAQAEPAIDQSLIRCAAALDRKVVFPPLRRIDVKEQQAAGATGSRAWLVLDLTLRAADKGHRSHSYLQTTRHLRQP